MFASVRTVISSLSCEISCMERISFFAVPFSCLEVQAEINTIIGAKRRDNKHEELRFIFVTPLKIKCCLQMNYLCRLKVPSLQIKALPDQAACLHAHSCLPCAPFQCLLQIHLP